MGKYEFELKEIKVEEIMPNPNNPRGDSVRDNDDQFQYLKRSIKEFGLLVPIVVQKSTNSNDKKEKNDSETQNKYILLDGERRYYAVKELGIKKIHAHVLNANVDANESKNLMFHIHTNRLQWDAYQQCKALEPLYEELKQKFNKKENLIAKQLMISTGTNQRTVNSRLNFLRWPKKLKDLVYENRSELYYTIVEIEAQIIMPAFKNFSAFFDTVSVDEVREFLLSKYLDGTIHAAIEARRITNMLKTSPDDKNKHLHATRLLKKLVENPEYTFENAHDDFVEKFPEEDEEIGTSFRKINLALSKTISLLGNISLESNFRISSEKQKINIKLKELMEVIEEKLSEGAGE